MDRYPESVQLVVRDLVPRLGCQWIQVPLLCKVDQVVAHGLCGPVTLGLRCEVLNP